MEAAGLGQAHRHLEGPMHQVWTRVLGSGIVNPHLAIGRGLGASLQSSGKLRAVISRSSFFRGRFNAASPQGLPQDPISKRKKATSVAIGVLLSPKSLNRQNYADLDQRLQPHYLRRFS